jgi:hypothetical protein
VERETVRHESDSEAEPSPREDGTKTQGSLDHGDRGKTPEVDPVRGKDQGGIANPYGDTADFDKTLKDR